VVWLATGLGVACVCALLTFLLSRPSGGPSLAKRAHLRLLILAAVGLSLFPGCSRRRRSSGESTTPKDDSLVAKWARLGRVWRELSAHVRAQRHDKRRRRKFDGLKAEMDEALVALPAWPELRVMFEARAAIVEEQLRYHEALDRGISCYITIITDEGVVQEDVSKQLRELEALAAQHKLSREAAEKAAAVLATQAQFATEAANAADLPPEKRHPLTHQLFEDYCEERMLPGPAARLAGKRLVELTTGDVGWLAGPPQENEGSTESAVEAEAGEEEAD